MLGLQNARTFNSQALVKLAFGDLTGSLADFDRAIASSPTSAQLAAIMSNRNALLRKLEKY